MIPGETICTGASAICDECGQRPLKNMKLSSAAGPTAIQTWCGCGPYSRETIYIESHTRATMILDACQRAVEAAGGMIAVEVLYVSRILEAFRVAR